MDASLSSTFCTSGPHDAQPLAERLGLRIVAFGLNRHDVARQAGDPLLDPAGIDLEGAVGVDDEPTLIEQVFN